MKTMTARHTEFVSTTRGLRRDITPMVLYERAKKLGTWNPNDIDFSQDALDWQNLTRPQRGYIRGSISNFVAGEEAVTLDLLPLIRAIANEGRVEETMYLTTFLFEEAKHVDVFCQWLDAVGEENCALERYHVAPYKKAFYEILPEAMGALDADPSRENFARASSVYNMGVEGIMAMTGFFGFFKIMDEHNILPGLREAVTLVKRDESRHIAYGIHLLSRLLAEDAGLWEIIESNTRLYLDLQRETLEMGQRHFRVTPFGHEYKMLQDYAGVQCEKRLARVKKAIGKSVEEVCRAKSFNFDIEAA